MWWMWWGPEAGIIKWFPFGGNLPIYNRDGDRGRSCKKPFGGYKVGPYDRYKWSYNLYEWPYKWVTGVISPYL